MLRKFLEYTGQFLVAALILGASAALLLIVISKLAPAFVDTNPAGAQLSEPDLLQVRRIGPFQVDFDTPPAKITRLPDPDYPLKPVETEKTSNFVGPPRYLAH